MLHRKHPAPTGTWQSEDSDLQLTEKTNTTEEPTQNQKLQFKKISINFYPAAEEILYAYASLLKYYKWKNFAVLYEDDLGLLRIQKILSEFTEDYSITVRRLDSDTDNHNVFKNLMMMMMMYVLS